MSVVTDSDLLKLNLNGTHNPSEKTASILATGKVIRISWNLNIQYLVHNNKPLVPILSQGDGFFTLTSHFVEFRLDIIILMKSVSWK